MEQKTQNTKPPILEDLNRWQKITEEALQKLLPSASTWPTILHQAMCYSLFAGGKRLRPAIIFASAETTQQFLGTNSGKLSDDCFERAKICACAIECLHTYSLIHDDLPCMDNDDLRRGRPTCHKVYGEAIAVLAGDALLTESFALLAKIKPTSRFSVSEFVACLARAASSRNLVGGQAADILSENKKISPRELRRIHSTKTAALLSASARLGAMSADAPREIVSRLGRFGFRLGLAFQAVDDILDVTAEATHLGKTPGKDAASGKATYPSLFGLDYARKQAEVLTQRAILSLNPLQCAADKLRQLAQYLLLRTH